jgi:TRAP-type C4-dicarboxylate transport system permease small subunit
MEGHPPAGESGASEATALVYARGAAHVAVWLGGGAMILVSLLVTVEVILREVFLIGLSAATEVSSYALAVSTAWAYAFTLLERNHVRVDALIRLMPARLVVWMDVLALLALIWFATVLLWYGYGVMAMSLETGAHAMTPLGTPLWIPQGLWVFGIAFFLAVCVLMLARALRLIAAGRLAAANQLIGTFSREEEASVEAEAAALRQREHAERIRSR